LLFLKFIRFPEADLGFAPVMLSEVIDNLSEPAVGAAKNRAALSV